MNNLAWWKEKLFAFFNGLGDLIGAILKGFFDIINEIDFSDIGGGDGCGGGGCGGD